MRPPPEVACALVVALTAIACSSAAPDPAPASPPPSAPATPGAYDVVIENGRIVDGSGNAWYAGDVGIRGDRITAVARFAGK